MLINQAEQKYLNEDHEQKTVKLMSRGKCAPVTLFACVWQKRNDTKKFKDGSKRAKRKKTHRKISSLIGFISFKSTYTRIYIEC